MMNNEDVIAINLKGWHNRLVMETKPEIYSKEFKLKMNNDDVK